MGLGLQKTSAHFSYISAESPYFLAVVLLMMMFLGSTQRTDQSGAGEQEIRDKHGRYFITNDERKERSMLLSI